MTGVIVGLAQWLILKKSVHRAACWISANALAWTLGIALIFMSAVGFSIEDVFLALATSIAGITAAGALLREPIEMLPDDALALTAGPLRGLSAAEPVRRV